MGSKIYRRRRCYLVKKWKEIIKDWEKSGLSRHAYCIQNRLIPGTFRYWQKKIAQASSNKSDIPPLTSLKDLFVPVMESENVRVNSSPSHQKIEVLFAQGSRRCLEGPCDWEEWPFSLS